MSLMIWRYHSTYVGCHDTAAPDLISVGDLKHLHRDDKIGCNVVYSSLQYFHMISWPCEYLWGSCALYSMRHAHIGYRKVRGTKAITCPLGLVLCMIHSNSSINMTLILHSAPPSQIRSWIPMDTSPWVRFKQSVHNSTRAVNNVGN